MQHSHRRRLLGAAAVALALAAAGTLALRQAPAPATTAARPQPRVEADPVDLSGAVARGRHRMTYYWIHEVPAEPEDARTFPVFDRSCRVLTRVPGKVRKAMRLEGTARLADGSVINLWGRCRCSMFPCFFPVEPTRPWGMGVRGHHLDPFRTVAVDPRRIKIGTALYVPELDGVHMPGERPWGGYVHDGCVIAADRGSGIRGRRLDFFVADRQFFIDLRQHRLDRVRVYEGVSRCEDRVPHWTPEALEVVLGAAQRVRPLLRGS